MGMGVGVEASERRRELLRTYMSAVELRDERQRSAFQVRAETEPKIGNEAKRRSGG